MRRQLLLSILWLAAFAPAGTAAPPVDEGIAVGRATEVVVSGRVFESATDAPLASAEVAVSTAFSTERATTGPDGTFRVTVGSVDGIGDISIEVSAYGFQQKYVETTLRDTFRDRLDATVTAGSVRLKAGKVKATLGCGAAAAVELEDGGSAPVASLCADGVEGIELTYRKNRLAILAAPPYAIRVESGRLEIQKLARGLVEIRIGAAMLPR